MNTMDIIRKYNFKFTKNLGQNFLIDEEKIENIINAMEIDKNDTIIEIGPGASALTKHLCERAKKVIAIEIDEDLVEILKNELKDYDNIEILHEDILKVDLKALIKDKNIKIVGNLPYYITSEIFYKILEEDIEFRQLTVMIQEEVCHKILSQPRSKQYIPLSIFMQYYFDIDIVDTVLPSSFFPEPKVTSSVMNFKLKEEKNSMDKKEFIKFVLSSFRMRRKTLRNNIKNFFKDESNLIETFNRANIDLNARAEEISVSDFYILFNALS